METITAGLWRDFSAKVRHIGTAVYLLSAFGVPLATSGCNATTQDTSTPTPIVHAIPPDGVHVWNVKGESGQAITVAKPDMVSVDIRSAAGHEVYCWHSHGTGTAPECVAWLPATDSYQVAISADRIPDRSRVKVAVVDDPYNAWSPTAALYDALFNGKVELVQDLINRGANVNASTSGSDGDRSPLDYAIDHADVEAVRILIANGANVSRTARYSEPPLAGAVLSGDIELARVLLDGGANPSGSDRAGNALLAIAIRDGSHEMEQLLRNAGAEVRDVGHNLANERVRYGDGGVASAPRLVSEIYYGNLDSVRELLKLGADPDATECQTAGMRGGPCQDTTPALVLATIFGEVEMVAALLRHGADPDAATVTCYHFASPGGCTKGTALMHAAIMGMDGSFGIRDEAIAGGWDWLFGEPLPPRNPQRHDGPQIAQLLLDYGADPDIRDEAGCTALMYAVKAGNAEVSAMLRGEGAKEESTCFDENG